MHYINKMELSKEKFLEYGIQLCGILGNIRQAFLIQSVKRDLECVQFLLEKNYKYLALFQQKFVNPIYLKGLDENLKHLHYKIEYMNEDTSLFDAYFYVSPQKWKNDLVFDDNFRGNVLNLCGTFDPSNENIERIVYRIMAEYKEIEVDLITYVAFIEEDVKCTKHSEILIQKFQEIMPTIHFYLEKEKLHSKNYYKELLFNTDLSTISPEAFEEFIFWFKNDLLHNNWSDLSGKPDFIMTQPYFNDIKRGLIISMYIRDKSANYEWYQSLSDEMRSKFDAQNDREAEIYINLLKD